MSYFFSRKPHVAPSKTCLARPAFTLVEILVALVVSLILMGAVVSLFGFLGDTFGDAKADIEMSGRVNNAAARLQEDLNNLTISGRPAVPGQPQPGALEIIEGRERDYTVSGNNREQWTADPDLVKLDERLGDRDDILYMTLRNMLRPYVGKQGVSIPSGGDTSAADAGGQDSAQDGSTDGGQTTTGDTGNCQTVATADDGTLTSTYSRTGSWLAAAAPGEAYDNEGGAALGDFEYSNAPGATATWAFTVSAAGTFEIGITWPDPGVGTSVAPTRASSITVVIQDGAGTPISNATIDQTAAPQQDQASGGRPFQTLLSARHLDPGDVLITLTVPGGGAYVLADGVRIGSDDGGCVNGKGDPPDDGQSTGGSTGGSTDSIGSGNVAGLTNESPLAEVLWFVTRDPNNPGRGRLHRYQLLISPDADLGEASTANFFYYNDISARNEGGTMVANSLDDLSLRRFRRAHLPATGVDSVIDPRWFLDMDTISADLRERINETVVLDNLVAFDVQVYDEAAPIVGVKKPGTTSGFGGGGGGGGTGGTTGGGTTDGGGGDDPTLLPPIDNGDPSFTKIGAGWIPHADAGYKNQYLTAGSGFSGSTATWLFTVTTTGEYDVYVTWPSSVPNAATNAKFEVIGDGEPIVSTVNQQTNPSGVSYGGVQFKKLGTMEVNNSPGTISVTLDIAGADGPIVADAAAIRPLGGSDAGGTTDGSDDAGQSTGGISPSDGIDALVAGTFSLTPTDIRYRTTLMEALSNADDPAKPQIVGYGAFVDLYQYIPAALNYETTAYPDGAPLLRFNGKGADASLVYASPNTQDYFDLSLDADTTMPAVYDTWSPWYNRLAVNQIDDDGQYGVDDPGEVYVPPPYSAPLKAIRVTIRVYEPTSGSVREVKVQRSFDQD